MPARLPCSYAASTTPRDTTSAGAATSPAAAATASDLTDTREMRVSNDTAPSAASGENRKISFITSRSDREYQGTVSASTMGTRSADTITTMITRTSPTTHSGDQRRRTDTTAPPTTSASTAAPLTRYRTPTHRGRWKRSEGKARKGT
ncbi:unannotated protein [freshwater metagenome]|uniref:Unannotated protein n=1 Tax=freshwater metagenome TaxID=449393 RepID=A0A6J7PAA9_9ZZZZ